MRIEGPDYVIEANDGVTLTWVDCTEEEWFFALENGIFEIHYERMEAIAKRYLENWNQMAEVIGA